MATGDAEDCNLLIQFVVDADKDNPFFSQQLGVGSVVAVTEALK